jgi:hypothetical protein
MIEMGFGKYILEKGVGTEIEKRYNISFKEFASRRYHRRSHMDILNDISKRKAMDKRNDKSDN